MLKMNKTKEIQSASMQLHKQINTINTFNNTSQHPRPSPRRSSVDSRLDEDLLHTFPLRKRYHNVNAYYAINMNVITIDIWLFGR